jgi:transcriptional activator SPT8
LNTGQVVRSFTRHKGPISAIQFRPVALLTATRNTGTVAITAHGGHEASDGVELAKANGDTDMEAGDAADAAGSPDSYGSLFGDEEEDDGSGKKQEKSVPAEDNATSSVPTQSVVPSALPPALQSLPPALQTSSVQAQIPPSRPGILSAGLKGQPRVGLPPLVPETYRQFSDDVMLVASMDGEVALHDRRIESSLVGKLEGSLKSGPWCMSVRVNLFTKSDFLYHYLTIA